MSEDSAQCRKWYFELLVEKAEPFVTAEPTHLRVGWACTEGYLPSPTGGDGWGSNGVGDDLYSYGFDGLHLWSGEIWENVYDLICPYLERACSYHSYFKHYCGLRLWLHRYVSFFFLNLIKVYIYLLRWCRAESEFAQSACAEGRRCGQLLS